MQVKEKILEATEGGNEDSKERTGKAVSNNWFKIMISCLES